MGKSGKQRKRQKLINSSAYLNDEDSEHDFNELLDADVSRSITTLQACSTLWVWYSSKEMKPLRAALFPLIDRQKSKFFEPDVINSFLVTDTLPEIPSERDILSTIKVAEYFTNHYEDFQKVEYKPFRRALHALVMKISGDKSKSDKPNSLKPYAPNNSISMSNLVNEISASLRQRNYDCAIAGLTTLRSSLLNSLRSDDSNTNRQRIKLGSLQRWIRECDVASTNLNQTTKHCIGYTSEMADPGDPTVSMSRRLLLAVLQIMNLSTSTNDLPDINYSSVDSVEIVRQATFRIERETNGESFDFQSSSLDSTQQVHIRNSFVSVVNTIRAAERRPPAEHDLCIYYTSPHAIFGIRGERANPLFGDKFLDDFDAPSIPTNTIATNSITPAYVSKVDIPGVPGAFLLTDVLSQSECLRILATSEAIGYVEDAVEGIDNVQWLGDENGIMRALNERCMDLLPAYIEGHKLAGINARLRLFRYLTGAIYRPHIDGAWPGSGLCPKTGEFKDDVYSGDRISKLTFLVYLTDGFEGGTTTFFLPSFTKSRAIDAYGVAPRMGSVLCFPHGDSLVSLVHEGSAVVCGRPKYVIRSDVLYMVKKSI